MYGELTDDVKAGKARFFFMQLLAFASVLQEEDLLIRHTADLSNFQWRPKNKNDKSKDGTYVFMKYENLHKFDAGAYKKHREATRNNGGWFFSCQTGRSNATSLPVDPQRFKLCWNLQEVVQLIESFVTQIGLTEMPRDLKEFCDEVKGSGFNTLQDANQFYNSSVQKFFARKKHQEKYKDFRLAAK